MGLEELILLDLLRSGRQRYRIKYANLDLEFVKQQLRDYPDAMARIIIESFARFDVRIVDIIISMPELFRRHITRDWITIGLLNLPLSTVGRLHSAFDLRDEILTENDLFMICCNPHLTLDDVRGYYTRFVAARLVVTLCTRYPRPDELYEAFDMRGYHQYLLKNPNVTEALVIKLYKRRILVNCTNLSIDFIKQHKNKIRFCELGEHPEMTIPLFRQLCPTDTLSCILRRVRCLDILIEPSWDQTYMYNITSNPSITPETICVLFPNCLYNPGPNMNWNVMTNSAPVDMYELYSAYTKANARWHPDMTIDDYIKLA